VAINSLTHNSLCVFVSLQTLQIASFIPAIPAGFTFIRYVCVTNLFSRRAVKDVKVREFYEKAGQESFKNNFIYTDVEAGTDVNIEGIPHSLEELYVEHEPGTWGPEHAYGFENFDPTIDEVDFFDWDASYAKVLKRLGMKESEIGHKDKDVEKN